MAWGVGRGCTMCGGDGGGDAKRDKRGKGGASPSFMELPPEVKIISNKLEE